MGVAGDKKYNRQGVRRDGNKGGGYERDAEFINLELDVEQQQELKGFRKELDAVNNVLTEMLDDQYKLTVRYDDRNECYVAFAFPADDHENSGYILAGRGGSGLSALAELLYKHSVVMARDWTRFASRARRRYSDED